MLQKKEPRQDKRTGIRTTFKGSKGVAKKAPSPLCLIVREVRAVPVREDRERAPNASKKQKIGERVKKAERGICVDSAACEWGNKRGVWEYDSARAQFNIA